MRQYHLYFIGDNEEEALAGMYFDNEEDAWQFMSDEGLNYIYRIEVTLIPGSLEQVWDQRKHEER